MSARSAITGHVVERGSSSALLVLGMHRSGTSAITGALRHCGAWTGEDAELTEANAENPTGFWERRDVRPICDRLLRSAGADWWKIATFDPDAIPHAILVEQKREFGQVVALLDKHPTWVLKEPRLCLLLPVLRDHITNPVCIHIYRNPLEVARSLQTRNGFSISAGLALWEAYNRRALSASKNLPRVFVFHEALMLHPVETIDALVKQLNRFGVKNLARPNKKRLKQLIKPSLYRRRATGEDTEEYLTPSQKFLWMNLLNDQVSDQDVHTDVSRPTRQHLLDLESTEESLNYHKHRRAEIATELGRRSETLAARETAICNLTHKAEELDATLKMRAATIEERDKEIRTLTSRIEELEAALRNRTATIGKRDDAIRTLTNRADTLTKTLGTRDAVVEARDETIRTLTAELSQRTATVKEREDAIGTLTAELSQRTAELSRRTATVKEREDAIGTLTAELSQRTAELSRRTATVKEREDAIGTLTAELSQRTAELSRRTATVKEREDAIGTLTAELSQRTAELSQRTAELSQRTAELSQRTAELSQRTETVKEREDAIRALKSRRDELTTELGRNTETIEDRDKAIRILTDRSDKLTAEIGRHTATIKERTEEMRTLVEERDEAKGTLASRTEEHTAELGRRIATIEKQDERIQTQTADLARHAEMIEARNEAMHALLASRSWRITGPLRSASRGARWFLRNCRRALKLLFWLSTGKFSRAKAAVRFVLLQSIPKSNKNAKKNSENTENRKQSTTAQDRRNEDRNLNSVSSRSKHAKQARIKVSVVAWDVGHNPLGRAYLLADVLRNDYDVELIGANFPRFGSQIWEPLRTGSRVPITTFRGGNFPDYFRQMEDVAKLVDGDIIYVSKPRLPGIELAILAKLQRNRPIILDIDDYELGFFRNRTPLSLDAVKAARKTSDYDCPHDEFWTRYSESLVPLFDHLTVSNEELQAKYGGTILPHIRCATDFDPRKFDRNAIRKDLGFTEDDKVIVFAGTPRAHKGVVRIAAALEKLNRANYKLLIVGSSADSESYAAIENLDPRFVRTIPNIPFAELPQYLSVGDLICLLQDKRKITSQFQMPAKFTDGLSMGIPMLATDVAPLREPAKHGLIRLLKDVPLAQGISEIFENYDVYKAASVRNREAFLEKYSYQSNLGTLKNIFSDAVANPRPMVGEFEELIAYHRGIFCDGRELINGTVLETTDAFGRSNQEIPVDSSKGNKESAGGNDRTYVDDKIDIVFFWKQNDSGIYGRRQDMMVKYLAKDIRINQILHFDAPIDLFRSSKVAVMSGQAGRHSHTGLVLRQTLRRKLNGKIDNKIVNDTFVYSTRGRTSFPMKWMLRSEDDYLAYLEKKFKKHGIGRRRTVFWVCPTNFHFPSIVEHFGADLVVADVIDDQRKWNVKERYREMLHENYDKILSSSDLVFANCKTVVESMGIFSNDIHMIPNAAGAAR